MHLSRFAVKNYKCLGDIDIPLTPIHVLIGPNDSGKTSLMEAMAAFCASSEQPLREIFPAPWSGRNLVQQGSGADGLAFRGQWRDESQTGPDAKTVSYQFAVRFPREGRHCSLEVESLKVGDQTVSLRPSDSPQEATTNFMRWKGGAPLDDHRESLPKELRGPQLAALSAALSLLRKRAQMYCLDPGLMAVPATIDPERRFRMDPDGFGPATLLDDVLGYRSSVAGRGSSPRRGQAIRGGPPLMARRGV